MPKNKYFPNSKKITFIKDGKISYLYLTQEEFVNYKYDGEKWPRVDISPIPDIVESPLDENSLETFVLDIYRKAHEDIKKTDQQEMPSESEIIDEEIKKIIENKKKK